MKTALGKGWKWLLGAVLGMLGFSGCEEMGLFRCEYGEPHADFKLIGDVKNKRGNPIPGIRVVFRTVPDEQETWENDTLYTDAKGHFEKERLRHYWPDGAEQSSIKFEDVDGSAQGAYKTKILTRSDFSVDQTKKGDKKWYSGEYTIRAEAVLEEED